MTKLEKKIAALAREIKKKGTKEHILCYKALVKSLPLSKKIQEIDEKVKKLKARRKVLASRCSHLAWDREDGPGYILETCVQCGKGMVQ